ncbi:MAG: hypothetical protein EOP06_08270 [Proteobacteria bacterium]|nr:MAG: hypothetical protein EOP06_08270 [Pseudomonadota bacterium]
MVADLEKAEKSEGGSPVHIEILLNFAPADGGSMDDEIKSLTKSFGLSDNDDLCATERVNIALSKIEGIAATSSQALTRFGGEFSRWEQMLSSLEGKPKVVANPQRKALGYSIARSMRSLAEGLMSTTSDFQSVVETIEEYGPLTCNLIDPASMESVSTATESIASMSELLEALDEDFIEMPELRGVAEQWRGNTPSLDTACNDLCQSVEVHSSLARRLRDSCALSIEKMKSKLP